MHRYKPFSGWRGNMAAIVIELYGLKIKDLENKMMDPGRHGYHVMAKTQILCS